MHLHVRAHAVLMRLHCSIETRWLLLLLSLVGHHVIHASSLAAIGVVWVVRVIPERDHLTIGGIAHIRTNMVLEASLAPAKELAWSGPARGRRVREAATAVGRAITGVVQGGGFWRSIAPRRSTIRLLLRLRFLFEPVILWRRGLMGLQSLVRSQLLARRELMLLLWRKLVLRRELVLRRIWVLWWVLLPKLACCWKLMLALLRQSLRATVVLLVVARRS